MYGMKIIKRYIVKFLFPNISLWEVDAILTLSAMERIFEKH